MNRVLWLPILASGFLPALAPEAWAQPTPYIGYVYPAGGQQGTTFQIRLGGQRLDGVNDVLVSGTGVQARVVEYHRKMSNQEMSLIREQLRELDRAARAKRNAKKPAAKGEATQKLIARARARMAEYVARPACVALSSLVFVEVTMDPDAGPGPREIRLVAQRGVSNPLVFHVGQLPEVSRKPMKTCTFQVLGKEHLALRKRPADEVEQPITLPCTMNGQIASGEVNRYRFEASKGQRLVISVHARQLIPYIADAVPGWFQPVVALYDADGKEVAFNDDYHFKPDPTLSYEVPKDGQYVLTITDAIYRGREDFVYRVSVSELPFVTSIFPLGGQVGAPLNIEMNGWNLQGAQCKLPAADAGAGVHLVAARKNGSVSNRLPLALDTLPECLDQEPSDDSSAAQQVTLPIIVNGRIDRQDDWDVFELAGRAGDTIVAEVTARRLDSPLDSMLKLTDASGRLLAFNDDHYDAGSGVNTHHADSYLMVELPADGLYHVHLGDTARNGGQDYAYRLRISAPRPDFELRVVPSSAGLRSKAGTALSIYAIRKDGFSGNIKVRLMDPPAGFSSPVVSLSKTRDMVRLAVRTTLAKTEQPIRLSIEGRAVIDDKGVVHEAVPAEDRMQAFLWRHLVPANDLRALVYNPSYQPPPKRVLPPRLAEPKDPPTTAKPAAPPKFSKRQVAGRLRQLKALYEAWLITDEFYARKVAECEAAL